MAIYSHGTPEKFAQACRCNLCVLVHEMYRAKPRPIPESRVDAGEARDHLDALRTAGWSWRALAAMLGYHENSLRNIHSGRRATVGVHTSEDICSIPVEAVA